MFRTFGAPEIILILVIILIFFGVGKLPQVGSALGKGLRAFKSGQSGDDGDADVVAEDAPVAEKPQKAASVKKAASK